MATVGIVDGHNLRISIGGTNIAKATSCSLSMSKETRGSSHKDIQNSWRTLKGGEKQWSMSCDALYAEAESYETLWNAFVNDTELTVAFSTDEVGDQFHTGTAIVTSLEKNADDNEDVTYTVQLDGTGALARQAVV